MKLCSVFMPSRSRVYRAIKSVRSLLSAEPENNERIEVLIRVDDDDPMLEKYHHEFDTMENVRLFVGPRYNGYADLWRFVMELAEHTDAFWGMQWNDDATIRGPWISELEKAPTERTWCQCQVHKLNQSTYTEDDAAPFPILPNGYWNLFPDKRIPQLMDTQSVDGLRKLGWTCHYLQGVSFHHVRDNDAELAKHRRMR